MFSNLNKPAFGTTNTPQPFGLGASTSNTTSPWGTTSNNQLFNKPANPTFGQPATTMNSIFPFFSQSNTSGFGSSTSTPSTQAFGPNLFGSQPATTSLFGSSTFGQQKPTGFGFGTQNQTQQNIFGQPSSSQNTMFQPATNLFGGNNAFGSSAVTSGTTVKFNPVTGTDTMQKSGVQQTINTKHHCITCMKEYEGKSLEELRLEDYEANRKGPQNQFGSTPFGTSTSVFGQPAENKTPFSQTTTFGTTFGQPNQTAFGLAPQSTTNNIFGKPPAFGTGTTSTSSFGAFNTSLSGNNTFGANQNKPFGSLSTAPLFGSTQPQQQSTPFGTTVFGQNNQQNNTSFFNKPAQTTFGTGSFGFGTPASTTTTSLFQQSKPVFGLGQTTSTNTFGQTPAFGATAQQSTFGNTFGKPVSFAQNQNTFQLGQTNLFNNTQQKPGSLLGGTGGGLFGTNTFTSNTTPAFGLSQPSIQPQTQGISLENSADGKNILLNSNQFGYIQCLSGLSPCSKANTDVQYATNPIEIRKMLESNKKVNESSTAGRLKVRVDTAKPHSDLFDEISDEEGESGGANSSISCKHLILKKTRDECNESIFDSDSFFTQPLSSSLVMNPSNVTSISDKIDTLPSSERLDILKESDENVQSLFYNKKIGQTTSDESLSTSNYADESQNPMEQAGEMTSSVSTETQLTPKSKEIQTILGTSISKSDFDVTLNRDGDSSAPKSSGVSGVVLTRLDYYTLPNMEELDLLTKDGKCLVKGFTVGRRGYGNVFFPEEVNVKDLNLDEIVHFRYKEIHVYPDESKKPPIGEGLNRRAQVTLDNVYPRIKETREVIKDVEQIIAAKFPEQMIEITTKHGLKFVDYVPETGSWVFLVDHFSKYGFTESDDEDCELSIVERGKEILKRRRIDFLPKSKEIIIDDECISHDSKAIGSEEYTDDDDQLECDILHKSISLDFDKTIDSIYEPSFRDIYYHDSHIQSMKAAFFTDSECVSIASSADENIDIEGDEVESVEQAPVLFRQPLIIKPDVWTVEVNIASRSVDLSAMQRCYSDMGIFKGESSKVGWNGCLSYYKVEFPKQSTIDASLSLSLMTTDTHTEQTNLKDYIVQCMDCALETSDFSFATEERIPTFKISKTLGILEGCLQVFNKFEKSENDMEFLYSDVWSLCNALWGHTNKSGAFIKKRLSAWLKNSLKRQLNSSLHIDEKEEPTPSVIFNYLTRGQIKEAALAAVHAEMPVLATLISQVNLSEASKNYTKYQLESFYKSMMSDHVDSDLLKIYLLLSGTPVKEDINVCEYLDWKRTFGLHLWYFINEGSPPQEIVRAYTNGFANDKYATAPKPPHEGVSYDIIYQILQLYQNPSHRLSKVLNPDTYTDIKTDYQLSWLLMLFFEAIQIGTIDPGERTMVHNSFSAQLERIGLWQYAILPLLYLEDNNLKRNLVLGVLNRNLSIEETEDNDAVETKLIEHFHIPSNWIETVKIQKKSVIEY